jgi:hypothetical protein
MKRNLRFAAAALLAAAAWLPGGMQAQTPYVPMKTDFGGTVVSDLNSFTPTSSDYTLEVQGTVGTAIVVSGGSYTYTPTTSGTVRFVQFKGKVYVYEGSTYMTTLTPTTPDVTFPNLRSATDNSTSGTGIYSSSNIIQNPGFETNSQIGTTGRYQDGTYWNMYNTNKVLDWNNTSGNSIRTGSFTEGSYYMLIHSSGRYLTQQLTAGKIKPATWYKIEYDYKSNAATQNNATYEVELGTAQFGTDVYKSSTYVTPANTNTQVFSATFQTGSSVSVSDPVWFCIHRTIAGTNSAKQCLDWLDRVMLVEGSVAATITGATSATYLDGTAYAPEKTLADGEYFDATNLLTNPSFETGDTNGWTVSSSSDVGAKLNSNSTYTTTGVDGNYLFNTWSGTATSFSISQSLTDLPKGGYVLKALYASDSGNTLTLAAGTTSTVINASTTGKTEFVEGATDKLDVVDGNLTISATSSKWFKVDNFRLFMYNVQTTPAEYYATLDAKKSSLITDPQNVTVLAAENTADAEWTTLGNSESLSSTNYSDIKAVYDARETAITASKTSAVDYSGLKEAIDNSTMLMNANAALSGYTALNTEVTTATESYTARTYTNDAALAEIKTLRTANAAYLATATDISALGSNLSFENGSTSVANLGNTGGSVKAPDDWTVAGTLSGWADCTVQTPTDNFVGTLTGTKYYNFWSASITDATLSQSVSGLPNGKYIITADMMVSATGINGDSRYGEQRIYGNTAETFYPSVCEYFTLQDGATSIDYSKLITLNTVATVTDGTLTFGFKTANGDNTVGGAGWLKVDNFKIYSATPYTFMSESTDYTPAAATNVDVLLNRTLKANTWNTLCLPFEVSSANLETIFGTGAKVAKFSGVTVTDEGNTKINFTTTDNSIAANQPCLINVPTAGNAWLIQGATVGTGTPSTVSNTGTNTTANLSVTVDMRGNYASLTDVKTAATTAAGSSASPYIVSNGNLYLVDVSTMILKPFRAYFTVSSTTGGSVKGLDITIDGETTDIEGINMNEQAVSGNVYNLKGQLVRKSGNTMEGLQKGVYIVNGKKQIVK